MVLRCYMVPGLHLKFLSQSSRVDLGCWPMTLQDDKLNLLSFHGFLGMTLCDPRLGSVFGQHPLNTGYLTGGML